MRNVLPLIAVSFINWSVSCDISVLQRGSASLAPLWTAATVLTAALCRFDFSFHVWNLSSALAQLEKTSCKKALRDSWSCVVDGKGASMFVAAVQTSLYLVFCSIIDYPGVFAFPSSLKSPTFFLPSICIATVLSCWHSGVLTEGRCQVGGYL